MCRPTVGNLTNGLDRAYASAVLAYRAWGDERQEEIGRELC